MKDVNIAIIDDHHLFLDGISMLVTDMDRSFCVKKYSAPKVFFEDFLQGAQYDLVLCDLIMDSMNGLAFVTTLRSHTKTLPILMLSGINTSPPINEVKDLGANGFVHKSAENAILEDSIRAVLAGQSYFVDGLGDRQDDSAGKVKNDADALTLTSRGFPKLGPRQIEVLRLIANGESNKVIAEKMVISENTVKTHLKTIFSELGVNKRTACVRKAQTLGLI